MVSMVGTVRWIFKGFPSSKPIPKEDHLLGNNVNHQGEARQKALLYPILGITKEIMSRGPQVLDMEYQEPYWLEPSPGGPILLLQRLHHVNSSSIHPIDLVLKQQGVLLHEVMSLSITVCVTLIFEAFEYVALNSPLFQNVCLEITLFNLFIPGG